MITSHIFTLLPGIPFELETTPEGEAIINGKGREVSIQIIPAKSVTFLSSHFTLEVVSVVEYFCGDYRTAIDLLRRAEAATDKDPGTPFRESFGENLILTILKVYTAEGTLVQISIEGGPRVPIDVTPRSVEP